MTSRDIFIPGFSSRLMLGDGDVNQPRRKAGEQQPKERAREGDAGLGIPPHGCITGLATEAVRAMSSSVEIAGGMRRAMAVTGTSAKIVAPDTSD